MTASHIYIAVSITVLLAIAILLIVLGRRPGQSRLTPLAGVAFAFVVAGTLFGSNRFIGYGLMAVGVVLALMDLFRRKTA